MPRLRGKDAIYEVASRFRDECLGRGRSLLWPSIQAWTPQNIEALVDAFVEAPDEGDRSFSEKLEDQLRNSSADVHRIAADILTFYFLFPSRTSPETKWRRVEEVIAWKIDEPPDPVDLVKRAFGEGGIGFPGAYYSTGRPWQFAFFILFAREVFRRRVNPADDTACRTIAREVEASLPRKSGSAPHVLLHLFFPDKFERIASISHKKAIAALLEGPSTGDLDTDIAAVRAELTQRFGRSEYDFYDDDVARLWLDRPEKPVGTREPGEKRVWIEKTLVRGRPDRIDGEYALGQALWSPERDKRGGDIYRFMREVQPGDLVLHLTDNEAFTGLSEAVDSVEKFGGVPGTAWEGSCYLVRLGKFRKIVPPLHRDVFFSSPYREKLISLADDGERNLFYHSGGALNQGKYLTPAPDRLIEILDEAYHSLIGRSLLDIDPILSDEPPTTRPIQGNATLAEVHRSFAAALREARLVFGEDHESVTRAFLVGLATKRFVILTGLSGSGKTQIAMRFGDWIGQNHYRLVPVRPDWTGAEAMFGFEDVLQDSKDGKRAWHVSETLEFMLQAVRNPAAPYLLILDEMNLAHVERYFADVLSGMESSQGCLPNLVRDSSGAWRLQQAGGPKLALPANLLIAGTVNVDETTYLFSPKVLDRANTFEFRVRTSDLVDVPVRPGAAQPGEPEVVNSFLSVCMDDEWHLRHPAQHQTEFIAELRRLHDLLSAGGFEFGHRVFYEAVRFATLLSAAGDADPYSALDYQVMQKVLPRLHGARRRLEAPLCALANYCYDLTARSDVAGPGGTPAFDPAEPLPSVPRLPRSFDKARRMTTALRANQFTSFTE